MCVAPRAHLVNVLGHAIAATRATHLLATPSLLSLLDTPPASLPTLATLAVGGELCPLPLLAPFAAVG